MAAGTAITSYEIAPGLEKKMIYFTVTLDASAKADFSAVFTTVDLIQAWDATTPGATAETVTSTATITEITFTNATNVIRGWAIGTV